MKTPVLMLSLLVLSANTQAPLRVLRTAPTDKAAPNAVVSVTFDRPVAGSLDRSVDPRSVLRVEPAVPGRFEWRDPITVRFTPAGLLKPGTQYTVFVSDSVAAIDGSRLESATRWTFLVDGPTPIVGTPVRPGRTAENIPLNARFQVVMNVPVDPAAFSETARVEPSTACSGPRAIRVRVASQRAINDKDTWEFQEAGGWQRDRSGDSLRRVVVLEPVSPLPFNCVSDLVMGTTRWAFQTYGPFQFQNAVCGYSGDDSCPTGSAHVSFSTPVSGAEVQRRVRIEPAIKFTVRDTTSQSGEWYLEGKLKPRTTYAVVVDPAMRDVFGQTVAGVTRREFQTTGFDPYVDYPYGSMLVERGGYQTLAVSHVNVPAFTVSVAAVPESLEAEVLARGSWALNDVWGRFSESVTTRRMSVPSVADAVYRTGVRIPADESGLHTLTLVRVEPENQASEGGPRPPALLQVTDLAVHVRVGKEDGAVWVTGVKDGAARRGVAVTLHDASGGVRARGTTDAQGLVRLTAPRDTATQNDRWGQTDGYVEARLGNDRAITRIDPGDDHLSAWRFSVTPAWEKEERVPAAAAVFTERGIYRPGETVYAKAIVRTGPLGALKVPARADSIRWSFSDREEGTIRDTTVAASRFGTSDNRLALPADLPLGTYHVGVALKRYGEWLTLGRAEYRVAEYRPPEFLVDVMGDTAMRATGDTIRATVQGRYLFGAPMARTPLVWFVRSQPMLPWDFSIPGLDGYHVGEQANWWEDFEPSQGRGEVATSSVDTLDAQGHVTLMAALPAPVNGRASRATVVAVVTDVNRQVVTGALSLTVHPAAIYVAARPMGESYFWTAGSPQELGVLAVRPDGSRQVGVPIKAYVVRREWHRVQRERDGFAEQVGEWVSDTIARVDLRSDTVPVVHRFTPPTGGTYIVNYRAVDGSGREAKTSLFRWATGPDWVPWGDENQFKMDVVPDKSRYSVGDTATVLFASPFTNAEAWITVEREGLIEQRRVRITSGATTLKLPITEAWAPNAFISILVARGRSAPPGGIGDPGRPTIRVGYAEVRVTPEVKRLAVNVSAEKSEYRPGDSVRVTLAVKDVSGRGQRSETAVWAVDEGVLALTGYRTPDPLALLYQPRSLGVRLGSNLTNVAEQIVDAEGKSIKGNGEPGGGGGADASDILRSRFSSTAFFLGSVVADSLGRATASARLPDNLTTFRLMAVAVTAGDRYGSGQSPLLVTRPLLARPALPRFLRPGDGFAAGVVVNQRLGGTPTVQVRSGVQGSTLDSDSMQTVTLAAGRGSEVRFQFKGPTTDTSVFRFTVSTGADADAVETRVPTRPDFVPRAHIASGQVTDSGDVELILPNGIDPARSRVSLSLAHSPLATLRQARRFLRVYPYECTEQVASEAMAVMAGLRVELATPAPADTAALRKEIAVAVSTITRRQRVDGGIGLWSAEDWTSPWLSAYAGEVLLEARRLKVPVNDSVVARLAAYLTTTASKPQQIVSPVARWYVDQAMVLRETVAAADFLSQLGQPQVPAENELLRLQAQLTWEDRVRLAEMLARRKQVTAARGLLTPAWAGVKVEGRRAVLPADANTSFYFPSSQRTAARLLTATLAVNPTHSLVGPLVETLLTQRHQTRYTYWNTQDYGAVVRALSAFEARQKAVVGARGLVVRSEGKVVARLGPQALTGRDFSLPLTGMVFMGDARGPMLKLSLTGLAPGVAEYYAVTVDEVPSAPPVTPDQKGIQVERWYEDFVTGRPIIEAAEGALVRVRLRVTIPTTRQFLVLDDPLPAGLEAVDLSLRTASGSVGPANGEPEERQNQEEQEGRASYGWGYGSWDSGWWSPFDHREMRDDRVVYVATELWAGTFSATYVARATTPGVFVRPPAHAEEMYNPAVQGRSDGGVFTVTKKAP